MSERYLPKNNVFVTAFTFVLALTLNASIAKGQEDGPAAIRTSDGYLFVWNRQDLHFSLSIKGKDIQPLNDTEHIFFNVDGKVFQIQSLPINNFLSGQRLDDKSILAAHRDWESKFVEGLLSKKLTVQSSSEKLGNGSDILLWQFDMPQGLDDDAKKQLYLTLVSKDYVLLFNSVATKTISESVARKFLLDTVATLKISSVPISVKELQEAIRKRSAP
jgi:hypothetical protein